MLEFEDLGGDDLPPWKSLMKPEMAEVVSPEGETRSRVSAYFSGKQVIIDDMSVDVRPGDEIRRRLPNGNEEAFFVEDPTCYPSGPFGPHYQVKVSRRGQFAAHTGGNYNVSVSGSNARVNIDSVDKSTNIAGDQQVFEQLRAKLAKDVPSAEDRERIGALIDGMEAQRGKPAFIQKYQEFMAGLSNHVTVFAALLPLLTPFLNT